MTQPAPVRLVTVAQAANYVTVAKFEALTGYTEDAVRAKISQAVWLEGKVWKRAPDGKPLISIRGYEEWVEGLESAPQAHRRSKSTFDSQASGAGRKSASAPPPPTSSTPQS